MESNGSNQFILKLSRHLCPSSCHFRALIDVADTTSLIKSTISDQSPTTAPLLQKTTRKSFSSNSGLFTTSSEERPAADAFFSLSSNSGGDSFRLRPVTKKIDAVRTSSFSSVNSSNAVNQKSSAPLTGDHISTELYYGNKRPLQRRRGRRRTARRVIGESYAVEKRTRDPRGDFRASMVEMIVEKQILGKEGLERLLVCLLSLNSSRYHGMILEVFTEICETLFTN